MTVPRTLLVLGGYSGVGKSRLTDSALAGRIPIFGPRFSEVFFALERGAVPATMASASAGKGTLRAMSLTGLTRVDCSRLREVVLLHLDLLSVVTAPFVIEDPALRERICPRMLSSMLSAQENAVFFDHLFAHRFFRAFDAIAINTLIAPWSVNAEQWLRRSRGSAPNHPEMFKQRRRHFEDAKWSPSVHRSVHAAWFQSLSRLAPAWSALSWFDGNLLRMAPAPTGIEQCPSGLFPPA